MLQSQFYSDLLTRRFVVCPISDTEFQLAEEFIGRYAHEQRLRTLDAIQLAVAIALHQTNLAEYFVSSDKILCQVAALEGFTVLNPENPS